MRNILKATGVVLLLLLILGMAIPAIAGGGGTCNPNNDGKDESAPFVHTFAAGTVITRVDIKTGLAGCLPPIYSDGPVGTDIHGSACYSVSGIGTNSVSITKVGEGEGAICQDISHTEVEVDEAPPPEVCEDPAALNYLQEGECEYPPPEVCEDPAALNYLEEGECEYPPPEVCEDPAALNYLQEGECEYPPPEVCEDPAALNYLEEGECEYPPPEVCEDPAALNYLQEGECEYPPPEVCEDKEALNYGEEAECEYPKPPDPVPVPPECRGCGPYYQEVVTDVQIQWYGADCQGNCLGKWRVIALFDIRLLNLVTGEMVEPTIIIEEGSYGPFYIFDDLPWEWSYNHRIVLPDGTSLWDYLGHAAEQRITCSSWPYYAFTDTGAWYLEGMVPSDMLLVSRDAWGLSYPDALEWSTGLTLGWNAIP